MFSIKGDIHDRYTLEFKMGYSCTSKEQTANDFSMDAWVFIPNTLGINSNTYSKERFYRDFRTMVRLITPVFTLEQIADPAALPLSRLEKWCMIVVKDTQRDLKAERRSHHNFMYEHQIKTFCAIVRSAVRERCIAIRNNINNVEECAQECQRMATLTSTIVHSYRDMAVQTGLGSVNEDLQTYFHLGDEYMTRSAVTSAFRLMDALKQKFPDDYDRIAAPLGDFIADEQAYQASQGYMMLKEGADESNRDFLFRAGKLKKYIESDLWLMAHSRSNTFLLQQFVFMIAAGVSMVWATVISFSFQQTYGNFTLPFAIALVISYMLKDRIKQLLQIWFATKLGSYMYEYKTKLGYRDEEIGESKQGMDFVHLSKLPKAIIEQRGNFGKLETGNIAAKENVIIFRRKVSLYSKKLARLSHYPLQGINEILRINLREFLRRMDSSTQPVYMHDGGTAFHTIQAEKVYYVHFVMRICYHGETHYKRFRVCLNRRGAVSIEEF